jgi:hypothetical protein
LIPGNVTARDIHGALLTLPFSRIDLLDTHQGETLVRFGNVQKVTLTLAFALWGENCGKDKRSRDLVVWLSSGAELGDWTLN